MNEISKEHWKKLKTLNKISWDWQYAFLCKTAKMNAVYDAQESMKRMNSH